MNKIITLAILLSLLSGCKSSPEVERTPEPTDIIIYTSEAVPDDPWAWDYEGPRGFNNWASLNPAYQMCRNGRKQSPINLKWEKPKVEKPLRLSYQPAHVVIKNIGYTFRIDFTRPVLIYFNNREYQLEKVEFRSPSEHHLSQKQFPLEVQMYHRSPNGLLIISSFFEVGRQSPWFQDFLAQAEQLEPQKTSARLIFDSQNLIPSRQTYYHYSGSLTHPPCLEDVEWVVFNTPQQISKKQMTQLRDLMPINNRPLQPIYDREVKNYASSVKSVGKNKLKLGL